MDLDDCFDQAEDILNEFRTFDSARALLDLCELSSKLKEHCRFLPTNVVNRNDYVTSVLAYLKGESNKAELLDELLNGLLKKTADPLLKATIIRLSNRLRELLQTKLVVIVAAMRNDEAKKLFNGAVEHHLVHEKISRLKKSVRDKGFGIKLNKLQQHYKQERDLWQPYGANKSILEIVESIHQQIPEFQGRSQPKLQIDPRTKDFFGDESFISAEQRAAFLDTIWDQRCLLVIDALSLFHPDISLALHTPALAEMKHMAILVLAPSGGYSAHQEQLYQLILDEIAVGAHAQHLRFQDDSDPLCEFGIADDTTLRRRLRMIMPKIGSVPSRAAKTKPNTRLLDRHEVPESQGWDSYSPRFKQ